MLTENHIRSSLSYVRQAPTGRRVILTNNGLYLLRLRDAVALCAATGKELARIPTRNYVKACTALQRALRKVAA